MPDDVPGEPAPHEGPASAEASTAPPPLDDETMRAHPAFQAAVREAVAVEVATWRRRARRRWAIGLGVPAVVAFLGFTLFSARVALFPTIDEPQPVQAIFVLGGPGNRIERGLELARQGFAPIVVVSQPGADTLGFDYLPICQDPPDDVDVRCVDPGDQRTVDEARMLTRQTFDNGWGSIIVVAGREQVTRARIIVRRCFPNTMYVVAAERGRSVPLAMAYEGAATIRALVDRRGGC